MILSSSSFSVDLCFHAVPSWTNNEVDLIQNVDTCVALQQETPTEKSFGDAYDWLRLRQTPQKDTQKSKEDVVFLSTVNFATNISYVGE